MNNLLIGGILSKEIAQELKILQQKEVTYIPIANSKVCRALLNNRGINYFKNIQEILLFDTSFDSLTDWEASLEIINKFRDKQVIIITRYVEFVPKNLYEYDNITIKECKNHISIDDLAVFLDKK